MSINTRLSGLLFVLLLIMSGSAALILQEELERSSVMQQVQLERAAEQAQREVAAALAAQGLRALLARLELVRSHQEAMAGVMARDPLIVEALTLQHGELLQSAQRRLLEGGIPHGKLRLVTPQREMLSLEAQASPDSIRTNTPLVDPPVQPASIAWQPLLQATLDGQEGRSLETVPVQFMLDESEQSPDAGAETLTLASVVLVPVQNPTGEVVGALLSVIDLLHEDWFLRGWVQSGVAEEAGAAVRIGGRVSSSVGGAGAALPPDLTQALELTAWSQLLEKGSEHAEVGGHTLERSVLHNLRGQPIAVLELLVAHRPLQNPGTDSSTPTRTEQIVQHGLSLLGILAVLALCVGVLALWAILAPLRKLVRKGDAISLGRLEVSVKDLLGNDEVGQIARSLDRLRLSLRILLERAQLPEGARLQGERQAADRRSDTGTAPGARREQGDGGSPARPASTRHSGD